MGYKIGQNGFKNFGSQFIHRMMHLVIVQQSANLPRIPTLGVISQKTSNQLQHDWKSQIELNLFLSLISYFLQSVICFFNPHDHVWP